MKNLYCAYYTNSEPITTYMVHMLDVKEGDVILEPSAGEGVFIDALLTDFHDDVKVDALDMDTKAISVLHAKYDSFNHVAVKETDTLFDDQLDFYSMMGGFYDKVIGNPPYGAWRDVKKRGDLKKKYPGYYVKESYTLFMLRSLMVLKEGGVLSFIVPDTFLFLNLHKNLRKTLLKNTKIKEILIFPSKFFPGVSFGYSNLSIITLEKTSDEKNALNNIVRVIKGFDSAEQLPEVVNGNIPENAVVYKMKQKEILNNPDSRLLLNNVGLDLSKASEKLSDYADVVTGFYTGDNIRFIRAKNKSVKGSKNYDVVNPDDVTDHASLEGIAEDDKHYIPYIKSSSAIRYARPYDEWYVQWDKEALSYYNSSKKARFQNSQFYFKKGIAIPMVKASKIRATAIDKKVFDQSIVGIFPKDEKYYNYILAIMNSDIVCKIIHTINPTANNSSNYVKLIPFVLPSEEELTKINKLTNEAIAYAKQENLSELTTVEKEINHIVDEIYYSVLSA